MIITRTIFMVLSSRITVTTRIHAVHLMNADSAPHSRQTSDQANKLGLWVCQKLASTICIHHRHLLLILSLQADTHFTVPQRDGRLSGPTDCSERAITLSLQKRSTNFQHKHTHHTDTQWLAGRVGGLSHSSAGIAGRLSVWTAVADVPRPGSQSAAGSRDDTGSAGPAPAELCTDEPPPPDNTIPTS